MKKIEKKIEKKQKNSKKLVISRILCRNFF